jgi:hypothetical protein
MPGRLAVPAFTRALSKASTVRVRKNGALQLVARKKILRRRNSRRV